MRVYAVLSFSILVYEKNMRLLTSFLAIFSFFAAVPVLASDFVDTPAWHSWTMAGLYGSDANSRGEATFFIPIQQTNTSLVFLDLRNKAFSNDALEGNYALGYRFMHDSGWNLGSWVSADARRSIGDNHFYQAAAGLEALHKDYDLRLNYYYSLSDPKAANGGASIVVNGNQIRMIGGKEVPLGGYDIEVGARLPTNNWFNGWASENTLRVYAGGFHFQDEEAVDEISGLRGRVEWTVHNLFDDIPGSELIVSTMHSSDNVRGDISEFGIGIKFPFGAHASRKPQKWSAQRRRMSEGLVRDIDIVTAQSREEKVKDAFTGVEFDQVTFVDTAAELTNGIAEGDGTLIVIESGTITGNFTVQADQTLLGGAGALSLVGSDSGTSGTYTAPGSRPTISSLAGSVLTADSNMHINGIAMTGSGGGFSANSHGIEIASNKTGMFLTDTTLSNFGQSAVQMTDNNSLALNNVTISTSFDGIFANSNNTISLTNSTILTSGDDAIEFEDSNVVTVVSSTLSGSDQHLVTGDDSNTVVISDSSLNTIAGDIISLDDLNTITFTNVTASDIGTDVFDIDDTNQLTVSGSSFSDIGSNVVNTHDGNTIVFTNSTIDNSALVSDHAFFIRDNNTITASGLTISGINGSIFSIDDNNSVSFTASTVDTVGLYVVDMRLASTDGNQLTIADNTFSGTVGTAMFDFEGTTAVTNSDNNVNNTTGSPTLCDAATGAFTGSINFTDGTSLTDGDANCN